MFYGRDFPVKTVELCFPPGPPLATAPTLPTPVHAAARRESLRDVRVIFTGEIPDRADPGPVPDAQLCGSTAEFPASLLVCNQIPATFRTEESTMRPSPWRSILVLATMIVITGCGSSDEPAPRHSRFFKKPDLHIGVFDDQAQIGLYDRATKRWSGFDIDVATYVMARLRVTSSPRQPILYSVRPADRKESLLGGGNDLVIASYSITDERIQQGITFSRPYLLSFQDILVRRSEAGRIKSINDLRGRKICTGPVGSTPNQQLQFINQQRKLGIEIYPDIGNQACVQNLLEKKVDAVVSDVAVISGNLAEHPDLHMVGVKVWPRPEQYAIGLIARSQSDIDEINAAVKEMLNDGTWRKIVIQNFCPNHPPGDEPCSAARLFLDNPPPST